MNSYNQKGVALISSLVILVVVLFFSISAMQSSRMNEGLSANYRNSTLALEAAEAGVSHVIKHMSTTYSYSTTPDCAVDGPTLFSESDVDFSATGTPSRTYNARLSCDGDDFYAYGEGFVFSGGDEVSRRNLKVEVEPARQEEDPRLLSGILAGGNVEVNGKSTIVGNVHANGDVDLKQLTDETVGSITASGTVKSKDLETHDPDVACETAVCAASGVDSVEIPPVVVSEFIGDFYDASGNVIPGEDVYVELDVVGGECDLNISGDQSEVLYYCAGDLNLSGSFNNTTIVADGNIDHGGSSNLGEKSDGEQPVDTLIAATGNIIMNGNDDSYAVFYANGSMTQNGNSELFGSIVVGQDVTRNGGIVFTDMDNVDNKYIPLIDIDGTMLSWVEVSST